MTDEIRRNVAWYGVVTAIALAITGTGVAMLLATAGAFILCSIFMVGAALSSWKGRWIGAATSIAISTLLLAFLFGIRGWTLFMFVGASLALSAAVITLVWRSHESLPEPEPLSLLKPRSSAPVSTEALTFDRVALDRGFDFEAALSRLEAEAERERLRRKEEPRPQPAGQEVLPVPEQQPAQVPRVSEEGPVAAKTAGAAALAEKGRISEEVKPEAIRLAEEAWARIQRHDDERLEATRRAAEETAHRVAEEERLQREKEERQEAERLAAEVEALRMAEESRLRTQRELESRLEAERRAAEAAAAEEARRAAEEQRLRREHAEAEALRLAEESRLRTQRELESRLAAERRAAEAAAAEEARRAAEEQRLRREHAEAERLATESAALRLTEEERDRTQREEARLEAERRAAEDEALGLAEEERARIRREDDERFARELEEARVSADDAAHRQIENERARLQREEEERQARESEEKRLAAVERAAQAWAAEPDTRRRLAGERDARDEHPVGYDGVQPAVRAEDEAAPADLSTGEGMSQALAQSSADVGYTVVCFTCHAPFEADDADWCSCLTKRRTLICTNCLTCLCKAPPAYSEGFWVEAPPGLIERRNASQQRSPVAPNPEPDEVIRPLVLSVEEHEEIQLIVQRVCINLGYGFIHAQSGREGLDLARRFRPDLILTDDFLPDLDGREMCRRLKTEMTGVDWIMVVMTGLYTDLKYRNEALDRFRVDDYIFKPVAITDLISLLERHLEGVTGLPRQEDLHELHRALIDQPANGGSPSDLPKMEPADETVTANRGLGLDGAGGTEDLSARYEIRCFHCGESFDAGRADWCAHLEPDPTLVCPRCGNCFCDAPPSFRERFWMVAPSSLFERRMILSKRGAAPPVNPSPAEVQRPLVLLVEDDENIRLMVRTVVRTMGFGLVATSDGLEGLTLAQQYHPDLILVDTLVPNLDGWQLCRLLRKDPATALVKAVIMTGLLAEPSHHGEASGSLDVDDYVAKPLSVGDLVSIVRKHLQHVPRPAM
jgi:CheY-like chemotaxis protein